MREARSAAATAPLPSHVPSPDAADYRTQEVSSRASHSRNSRTLRRLARHITSKASPTTGTAPKNPSSATLASMRMMTCKGAPNWRASCTRGRGCDRVTDPGKEPYQRIETEAYIGAGQDECSVQERRQRIKARDALGMRARAGEIETVGETVASVAVGHGPSSAAQIGAPPVLRKHRVPS